jgi:two-component system phosphate regulon sensor histidine kinase PhoR
MTDARPDAARRAAVSLSLLVAASGVAVLIVLWALGWLGTTPAVFAGVMVAVIGVYAYARGRPSAVRSPVQSASSAAEGEARALPFALILERLADPVLLAAGGERPNLNTRRFLFANAAARALLRIQRPEGPLSTAIRAPEVLAAVDEALFDRVTGHALYQAGGVQDRVWRVRVEPLDVEGETRLALISLRDETEFRRSERTRADFLANASHELRTPLASLTGFIETLRGHAREDPAARDRFLAIMHVQAVRMRRLIDDLMSLSRIELGEHIPPSGQIDLSLAVIDVLDALGPLAEERGVVFRQMLPPLGQAVVVGDRDQILQVVQNLAENALKYTPAGGAVTVRLETQLGAGAFAGPKSASMAHLSLLTPDHAIERRYAALRVEDEGPGIARENLPRLTERFYRVEGQKSGEHAGTGLGLAIVKHIVNRHRGGLTVESAEGRGAAFTAYIPMAAEANSAAPTSFAA